MGSSMIRQWHCLKLASIFGTTFALLLLTTNDIRACSCRRGDFLDAFNAMPLVFIGKPLKNAEIELPLPERPDSYKLMNEFSFKVSKVLKGNRIEKITIRTGSGGGDCGYGFEFGKEYLVFAWPYKGLWYTSICTYTTPRNTFSYEARMLELDWSIDPKKRIRRPTFEQIESILNFSGSVKMSCDHKLGASFRGKRFYFLQPTSFKFNDPIEFKDDDSAEYSDYEFKNYEFQYRNGTCTIFFTDGESAQYRLVINSKNSIRLLEIWNNAGQENEEFFDRGLFFYFPEKIPKIDIVAFTLFNKYATVNLRKEH